MREKFPGLVVDGLHRLGCCVRPCLVMMQDDSFKLMPPAFVLCVFFALVLYVCPLQLFLYLFFMKDVAPHIVDIIL